MLILLIVLVVLASITTFAWWMKRCTGWVPVAFLCALEWIRILVHRY